jgi:TrmH family RNA methyltransferase
MQTLSKAKIKLFSSLQQKKYRLQSRLFVVEGKKMLAEALASNWPIESLVLRDDQLATADSFPPHLPTFQATAPDFKRISAQTSPEGILAVLHMPEDQKLEVLPKGPGFLVAGIQDPGNLGTLLRTANWFGHRGIVLGPGTVDVWNPKTLRASMGAIFRLPVYEVDGHWSSFLRSHLSRLWIADMGGESLVEANLPGDAWVLLGNEAQGISEALRNLPGIRRIHIPRFGQGESLNVGIAAGILAWKLQTS